MGDSSSRSSGLVRALAFFAGSAFVAGTLVHAALFGRVERPVVAVVLVVAGTLAYARAVVRGLPREAIAFGGLALFAMTLTFARVTKAPALFGDNLRYVAMVEGGLSSVREEPFASRWLTPLLAGPLDVTPSRGEDALAGLGFASLVVATFLTACLASRLARTASAGLFAIVVLATSYFAEYAAWNRLLTDPQSYALGALLALAFLEGDALVYAAGLFLLALNSEKAVFFLPLAFLLDDGVFDGVRALRASIVRGLVVIAPAVVPIVLRFVRFQGQEPVHYYPERVARLLDWPPSSVWFPFYACTVPAVLSALLHRSRASVLAWIGVAAFVQVAFADDTERMTAYAFAFLVPFAARFAADAAEALARPRTNGVVVMTAMCLAHRAFDGSIARLLSIAVPLVVVSIPAVRRTPTLAESS